LKITFLGTGTSQGVPLIACECPVCQSDDPRDNRLRSSVMIEINKTIIIIDAGTDFRQQMLREKVRHIDAVLITHGHKDHIGGLDDIRAFNYVTGKPVDIYASQETEIDIRRELYYAFSSQQYPGIPRINIRQVDLKPFQLNGINILPLDISHHFLSILGYKIEDFTYITDCSTIPDETMSSIYKTRILVINALRKTEHISHLSLSQALDLIEKIQPEKAYITHLSHLMGKHGDVSKELPENVELAYDGLRVTTDH